MKRFSVVFCIFLLLVAAAQAAPIVFVVRHAEKAVTGGENPDLSVAGQKRAEALARILKDSQITAIFVTEFKRTQDLRRRRRERHTLVPRCFRQVIFRDSSRNYAR